MSMEISVDLALAFLVLAGLLLAGSVIWLLSAARKPRVFISYRRTDKLGKVEDRLYDDLVKAYGLRNVFLDAESIPYGKQYPHVLQGRLADSHVVIALVGPEWDGGLGDDGYPRILNDLDWIRYEVSEAFKDNRLIVVSVCDDVNAKEAPGIPEYDSSKLQPWQREEQYKLLITLGQLQAIRLGKSGDGYRAGGAKLLANINRRHGRQAQALFVGAVLAALLLVGAGIIGICSINGIVGRQQEQSGELDRHEEQLGKQRPKPILPYSLTDFVDLVKKPGEKEKLQDLTGAYVFWQVRWVKWEKIPGDDQHVNAVLKPVKGEDYAVRAKILVGDLGKDKQLAQENREFRVVGSIEDINDGTQLPTGKVVTAPYVFLNNASLFRAP